MIKSINIIKNIIKIIIKIIINRYGRSYLPLYTN